MGKEGAVQGGIERERRGVSEESGRKEGRKEGRKNSRKERKKKRN